MQTIIDIYLIVQLIAFISCFQLAITDIPSKRKSRYRFIDNWNEGIGFLFFMSVPLSIAISGLIAQMLLFGKLIDKL